MNKLLKNITIFLYFFSIACFGDSNTLSNSIDKLIQQYIPNANIGIIVSNTNGKIYYAKNANKYFTPASNTKLFTAVSALLSLGSEYKFKTKFFFNSNSIKQNTLQDNLYISFSGDPTYTTENLIVNLKQLRNYGINKIEGNIVINETNFIKELYTDGLSYEDTLYAYGIPSQPLILDRNTFRIKIKGQKEPNKTAEIVNGYQNHFFTIKNNIKTIESDNKNNSANISGEMNVDNNVTVNGEISTSYESTIEIPINNVYKYFSYMLIEELRNNDISFDNKIIIGTTPKETDTAIINKSPPLHTLIKHALKESDNLYADSIFKIMGKNNFSFVDGAITEKAILTRFIGATQFKLYDGSGLSRYNLVTPIQVITLLVNTYNNNKLQRYILDSLPISGIDGTLINRMKNDSIKGKIKAKTGTVNGVSSLSGFICFEKRQPIAFSVLINGTIDTNSAKTFENEICLLLYNYFLTKP